MADFFRYREPGDILRLGDDISEDADKVLLRIVENCRVTEAGCWLVDIPGPGGSQIRDQAGNRVQAHRYLWGAIMGEDEFAVEPVPEGTVIARTCRNDRCCAPAHLDWTTNSLIRRKR